MATKCPHCEATTFESVLINPENSHYPVNVIQCSECQKAIGIDNTEQIKQFIDDLFDEIVE